LQTRLATYALVVLIFYIPYFPLFYLIWSPEPAVGSARALAHATHTSAWLLGVVHVCFVLLTRVRTWSVALLVAFDVCANALIGGAFAAIVLHHPSPQVALLEGLLALASLLWLRALLVPSSVKRSVTVGLLVCGSVAIGVFGELPHFASRELSSTTLALLFVNWAVMIVGFSAYASSVLYGLRREVQSAQRFGQYTLLEKLGEGGMGVVYRAQHAMLRRPTALKLLNASGSAANLTRFEQEVQLMAELTHRNAVTVHDYGRTADGVFYYAMEHLDGIDLEALVQVTGPQPPARVIHLLRQACGALGEAHGRGLIHRDVKPGNVFVCRDRAEPDLVKVLDFGLVKDSRQQGAAGVTGEQTLVGTPLYMSPESISKSSSVDARSDLYSLAAVGYLMLCGEPVFSGNTVVEICAQHLFSEPVAPSLRNPSMRAADLEGVLLRCLSKQPDSRPATAAELAAELDRCSDAFGWSAEAASKWWSDYGPGLEARRVARAASKESWSVGHRATIAVDRESLR
jgi:serine/threonine-protein kinase